jgi:hypothetical protein
MVARRLRQLPISSSRLKARVGKGIRQPVRTCSCLIAFNTRMRVGHEGTKF